MRQVWTGSRKVHRTFEDQAVLPSGTAPEWSQTRLDGYRWTTGDGQLLARIGGHLGTMLVCE
jgi:hypothetical protein